MGGNKGLRRPGRPASRLADPPIRHPLASRPKYVTMAAVPFLFGAFFQGPTGMAADLAAFGTLAGAMWMTGQGLAAEAAYQVRGTARRPAVPRKLLGSLLTGLGLGLGVADPGSLGVADPGSLGGAGLVGATGMVLHWLAFGPDPLRDKGVTDSSTFQHSRAERMIEDAEAHLAHIHAAIESTGDHALVARTDRFAAAVEALFDRLRSNPGDLSAARRYMTVYLEGTRDAAIKFADIYRQTGDGTTRRSFETFLDDLENDFDAMSRRLVEGDKSDLEIEIAVLRDRLAREGVASGEPARIDAPPTETARFLDTLLNPGPDKAR